jgi:hypothetical protein
MRDAANPSDVSGGEIQNREQLIQYLWEAVEIEHQLQHGSNPTGARGRGQLRFSAS